MAKERRRGTSRVAAKVLKLCGTYCLEIGGLGSADDGTQIGSFLVRGTVLGEQFVIEAIATAIKNGLQPRSVEIVAKDVSVRILIYWEAAKALCTPGPASFGAEESQSKENNSSKRHVKRQRDCHL